ncbi:MAG: hypothetical protein LBH04_10550 [Tannerellaceae bacterium]|nr:hypothetical protein [Tannerellaceae bacterium]
MKAIFNNINNKDTSPIIYMRVLMREKPITEALHNNTSTGISMDLITVCMKESILSRTMFNI